MRGIHIIVFLFLHENICCGYMFSWRNKKDISIFQIKKPPLSVAMIQYNLDGSTTGGSFIVDDLKSILSPSEFFR